MKIPSIILLLFISLQIASSINIRDKKNDLKESVAKTTLHDTYKITKTYQRPSKQYYTQGLKFVDDNTLIESTGLYGESKVQYLSLQGNQVVVKAQTALNGQYFGEGCDFVGIGKDQMLYQLTWQEGKIFTYEPNSLEPVGNFPMPKELHEGWGFATRDLENAKQLVYMTDGTDKVYVYDSKLNLVKTLQAHTSDGKSIDMLNELEFVKGKLWANIYTTNSIVVIEPDNGLIEKVIQLDGLQDLAAKEAKKRGLDFLPDYVLNGIAYNKNQNVLLVTGKKWPLMWQIEIEGIDY